MDNKRFIYLKKYQNYTLFFDKENNTVPFILISNQELLDRDLQTTRDLLNSHAYLLSSQAQIKKIIK